MLKNFDSLKSLINHQHSNSSQAIYIFLRLSQADCYDRWLSIRNLGGYLHENFTEYTEFAP